MKFLRILLGITLLTISLSIPSISQAAAATKLVVTGFSSPQRADEPGTLTVEAQDNSNNRDTGYTGTVRFSSTDGNATLPVDYRFTATDAGVHTFKNGLILRTTGTQVITATDTVTGSITGNQAGIVVSVKSAFFAGALVNATGNLPRSVISGDFNGDGKPDLAVTNSNSSTVSILIGNGDNTFQPKVDYTTGGSPWLVISGDFNADGKPDLAVTNNGNNTVSILIGNGNGTFQNKVDYTTGTNPWSVTTADFNADGKPDLAVANSNSSTVSILLGNGNGTFQNKVDYATGTTPYSVTSGDFNADGKPDLAVVNRDSYTVSILLGNGNGTFQNKVDYTTDTIPYSVTSGDFNADGKLDLAVVNNGSNSVSILLGNGNGTFQNKIDYATGTSPYFITSGDFNGDGNLDLAIANSSSSSLSILLGNGNGTFQSKVDYITDFTPYSVTAGDFNSDGKPDLAVANTGNNSASVLLGNGNGTFQTKTDYATGSFPYSVTSGDFNADGKPDLAVANHNSNSVSIFLGNGDNTFQSRVDYGTGTSPWSVISRDVNGDGKPDLAVANGGSDTVSVLINNGNGTFQNKVDYATATTPISVTSGDFNADGKMDLAVVNSGSNTVSILLGNGNGTFQTKVDYATGNTPYSVTSEDFNADGKADLAVANNNSNTVSILLGNGDGTFQTKVDYTTGTSPWSVISKDVNGDGKPDLAVVNSGSSTISILLGNGNGTFQNKVDYAIGATSWSVTAEDFNGDGKPDLAVANYGSTTVSVLLGNGDGTFQPKVDYATGSGPVSVTSSDFNNDGKPDLAVANTGSSTVSILRNNTSPSWTGAYPSAPSVTADTAQLLLKSPESGSAYLLALTSSSPAPTAAQVKAGKNAAGILQAANLRSTVSMPATTEESYSFTGLSHGTAYTIYAVMENSLPALQATPLQMQIATRAEGLCGSANGVPTGSAPSASLCAFGTPSAVTGGDPWAWSCIGAEGTASCSAPLLTWPLTLSFSGNSSGTVNYSFGGSCSSSGGGCGQTIIDGTAVTLTTSADSGAFFAGWSGDCTGTGSCQLTITSAKSVTASFKLAAVCGSSNGGIFNSPPASGLCAIGTPGTVTPSAGNWIWNCDVDSLNTASCSATRPAFFLGVTKSGNGTLQGKVDYTTGSEPWSVTSGDFNGDGKQDLAVANAYSNTISILLGNGDGTFQNKVDYATGSYPYSITAGDFNADGKSDLAVTNYNSNTVSILLGNGNGSFQTKVDYVTGSYPNSITVGDFNGDGKPDLAVTNINSNTVSILLGTGTGSFQTKVDYATGSYPNAISVADVNGDGKLDLAITDSTPVVINKDRTDYNDTISILLGNGNGTFQGRLNYTNSYSYYWHATTSVTVGDFNAGGKPDRAVTNYDNNTVSILLGNGNGTFQTKVDYNAGYEPSTVTVGDFNGDGKQDLAVANYNNDTVSILLGNGTGTFQSRLDYTTGSYPRSVVVGDFNGDGTADLAVTNAYGNSVSVLLGHGNGKGRVTSAPAGIDCGSNCSESVYATDTVTLTATPDNGMAFAGWTGACNGTGSCTVTMNGARSVDAQFVPIVNGACGTNNDAAVPYGPNKGLCQTGTPSAVVGNGPWSWSCTGTAGGTTASCMTTTLKHDLTTTFTGDGSVTFTTGDGCTAPFACTRPFAAGQSIWLTPSPHSDYTFSHWTGACSSSDSWCYVSMDSAKNVGAVFEKSFPKPIPEKGTIISNLTVPAGSCNSITDLKVAMDITHPYIADLQLVLRAPNGYGIPLFSNGCVSLKHYANIVGTFTDSGSATVTCPPSGDIRPLIPFNTLAGSNAAGTWTLEINDTDIYDFGVLNSWNLNFTCAGGTTLTYPTYVPRIWLKADAGITMDGAGKISNWADQTANEFDVSNLNADKQPLFVASDFNGQPAVRFDGTDDYLQTKGKINLLNDSKLYSYLIVIKPDSSQKALATVLDYNNADNFSPEMQQDAFETNVYSGQQLSSNMFQVFSYVSDIWYANSYLNGTNPSFGLLSAPSYSDPNYLTIGNKSLEAFPMEFKGDIAEIIVYNQALPQAERQAVETSLFAKYAMQYGLTTVLSGEGSGTVTSLPTGINCGTSCSAAYNSGTSVTLTATPASGSLFAGWSGDCSGTGTCTVSMNQANSVMATFEAVVTASCGSSNNVISPVPPSSLCSPGSASRVTGNDPWKWTCTGKNGGSSTTCTAPLGKAAIGSAYYTTLSATLAAVTQGATVKARNFSIYEDLIVNNGKSFNLQGGYDPYFSGRSGTTTINSLTVSTGRVTLDGITIK